jgi:hypothetical protein
MADSIHIGIPRIEFQDDHALLIADVSIQNVTRTLWFKVTKEYASHLTPERGDAFVVGLLFEALERGLDITCEAPLSDRLIYQISSALIDFLVGIYPDKHYRRIQLHAQAASESLPVGKANGTGISCGIDSLAAIARQSQETHPGMGITHLCFFDTGSHDQNEQPGSKQLFAHRRAHVLAYCAEARLPCVEVSSNLSEFYTLPFGLTHTYRNAAPVLALQKLFANYYYASAYTTDSFLDHTDDPAYFEIFLLPMISTRNTTFYSSESTVSRLEKTRIVAQHKLAERYLNVCNSAGNNCGRCNKCVRTLLALDIIGCINRFDQVFDLPAYHANLESHLVYHCCQVLRGDTCQLEIDPYLRDRLTIRIRVLGLLRFMKMKMKAHLERIVNRVS